jgi:DNA repair exonuclease SbcCD ATPase subunit
MPTPNEQDPNTLTPTPAEEAAALEKTFAEMELEELPEGDAGGEASDGGAAEASRQAEREALSKGWTPKDKFKGDPAKWVDAKTFVERGKRFNQNLQNEVQTLKRQLEEFRGTATAFKKFHDEVMQQKEEEIEEAKKELKRRRREADREGDDDTVEKIDDRLELLDKKKDELKTQAAEVQAPANVQQVDPVLQAWIEDDNDWFRTDARLRAYSIEIGQELKRTQPKLEGRAFLDEVRRQMEEDFPKKFGYSAAAPRRTVVDGGGSGRDSGGASVYSERDLPKAERELMVQFIKEGWTTKEKFLKSYFERNPR